MSRLSSPSPTLEAAPAQETEKQPQLSQPTFPDGGLEAWLVVLGGAICNVLAFGYVASYGVFQSYYEINTLSHESPSSIAWIGSIQAFMLLFPGLFAGALFDKGWFRLPLFASSVLLVISTFLVAQCTKYWHFVLCQGIASGFAQGMLFSPVMTVVGHWFQKRRGFAFGLVTIGSSIGGVTIPIMTRKLIPQIGFQWTLRALAFMFFGLLIIPNLTLKPRLPTHPQKGIKAIWDPTLFKNPVYSVYIISGFFSFLGYYGVFYYIDITAVSHGIDKDFSFYLVSILNAVSALGRFTAGRFSDRIGAGNTVIPALLVSAAVSYAWPFATEKSHFIVIVVFYGLSSGAYIATFIIPIFSMGPMKDLGKRIGMSVSLISFAALAGSPIAGALVKSYGYKPAGYFCGSCMFVGGAIALVTRQIHLRGKIIGKY